MTVGSQALFVGAVAVVGEFPYLLPSGENVGELAESATADGEYVLAVGGVHGGGHVPVSG